MHDPATSDSTIRDTLDVFIFGSTFAAGRT
jgi:hypothetical protein